MARRVQESDLAAFHIDFVRTDMLGYPSGLAGDHVAFADVVEEGSLAMVHMPHDGHDGRTWLLDGIVIICRFFFDILQAVLGLLLNLVTEFRCDGHHGIHVQPLVDRHHQSELQAFRYDVRGRHEKMLGQFAPRR